MKTTSKKLYHWSIDQYINKIRNGEILACKEIHELIDFLELKLNEPDVVIDGQKIDEAIENIEKHFPFKLLDWEVFILAFVVGVLYSDGTLMFNEFLIMMGRGGGKTGFMSIIEWYLTTKQGINKYHVDIVATSEDQAKESFDEVHTILEDNKKKYKKFFRWTMEKIVFQKTRSTLRYRTNNAKTKDGGRQGAVIFDEVHAYENEDSIKVFTSGLGKKKHPRRFYFTTDGYVRDGFLDQLKLEAKMILAGERPKRRTFPFICKIDDPEEVHDPNMWEKANPSIRYFSDLRQEMMDEYEKLEDRPSSYIEFMTKRMNIPSTDSYQEVTDWEVLMEITNISWPDLRGRACIGAIDYSDTTDFVGLGLLFKVGDKYFWLHHTLINKKSLKNKTYKVDLELAKQRGLVTFIDDETNKPEYLVKWFMEMAKLYNIKMITGDLYRINYVEEKFKEAGFGNMKVARSGWKTHTMLQPIIEDLFSYRNIIYAKDDFMMRWYTNNTFVQRDAKQNITYEKIEPKLRKTDGFAALLHALQFKDELNVVEVKINRKLRSVTGN
jgi:phage terminase large subunit-like protein